MIFKKTKIGETEIQLKKDVPAKRFRIFLSLVAIFVAVVAVKPVFSHLYPPLDLYTQIAIKEQEALILDLELMKVDALEEIEYLKNPPPGVQIVEDPFSDPYSSPFDIGRTPEGYRMGADGTLYPLDCFNGKC